MNEQRWLGALVRYLLLGVFVAGSLSASLAGEPTAPSAPSGEEPGMPLGLGGAGGVYPLAEPGELQIEVQKRDRHRGRAPTELRALLVGPDRRVLQEAAIPPDGQAAGSGLGPIQRATLATRVPRRGVYAVNVTVSNDRYGEDIVWGFTTNCPRYLIETARGHKDERHQEPIVLRNPSQPGDVVFRPRREAFAIELSGLPADARDVAVYDAQGTRIADLAVSASGTAAHVFPAAGQRPATPWRLHLPAQQATLQIDGVTRREAGDRLADIACWTTQVAAWFPLLDYRWLLTAYQRFR